MKLNLKAYWREILIGILIALLIWVSSSQPKIIRSGSSDTVCITDTLTKKVPVPVRSASRKIFVVSHDTVHTIVRAIDTLMIQDTSWLYADIPLNEYRDTSYYIRTIGWLDSVSVYCPKVTSPKLPNFVNFPSLHVNTQIGTNHIAPGATLQYKKVQVGYNYNIIQGAGNVTLGYKIF